MLDDNAAGKAHTVKRVLVGVADSIGVFSGYPGLGTVTEHLVTSLNANTKTKIRKTLRKGTVFADILRKGRNGSKRDS